MGNKIISKKIGIVSGVFWCILALITLIEFILSLYAVIPETLQSIAANNSYSEIGFSIGIVLLLIIALMPKILIPIFLFTNKSPRIFTLPFGILLITDIVNGTKAAIFLIILLIAYFFVSTESSWSKIKNILSLVCCLVAELIIFIYYCANGTYNLPVTIFYIISYALLLIYVYNYSTEKKNIK